MIAFSCAKCGMKFDVKDEFAGRALTCRGCKTALTVPSPHEAAIPAQVDGAQPGLTIDARPKRSGDDTVEPESLKNIPERTGAPGERYVVEEEIARGGMGVVRRAVDAEIRREVALKYLLDQSDPNKTLRFIEEAQITGQLEHPNVVPVHDLTMDAQKQRFFSMKLVHGRSLAQIFDDLRNNNKEVIKGYTLGKLLIVLVGVCNGLAYAHSKDVVHRDIKPANIMVGDFGEVYVMDWGLAKVIQEVAASMAPVAAPIIRSDDSTVDSSASNSGLSSGSNKIITSRQADCEQTMEGTIMGTPAYMAPEQASGQVKAIGPRADVYSVGALLYEMLTLQAPIVRDGGFHAMLLRVAQGEIIPPEKRTPERAHAGLVPPELAAIAMKALATNPDKRYPSVEALRRDIELFQEGRSVSAKEDSKRELIIKFVRRNRAFSAVSAVSAVLLVLMLCVSSSVSSWFAVNARKALADNKAAQKERHERTRQAVPALVDAGRLSIERRQYDNALTQVKLALEYDPDFADALLLHAQLLVAVRKDFAGAQRHLDAYLKVRRDENAKMLRDLCARENPEKRDNLLVIAEIFTRQHMPSLAERAMRDYGSNERVAREFLLKSYRDRVAAAWKGLEGYLKVDNSGIYSLDFTNCHQVSVLTALNGLPLTRLSLQGCNDVRDIGPLKGMPLTRLNLTQTLVSDLTPLENMQLNWLDVSSTKVRDIAPLRGMPLAYLNASYCRELNDVAGLLGMQLTTLHLRQTAVRDLAPLKDMPLTLLNLHECKQLTNLGPLAGMKLNTLDISHVPVTDLTPLQGIQLTSLTMDHCTKVRDLTPLKDMDLTTLAVNGCTNLRDLTPLSRMRLRSLNLNGCSLIQDLTPLAKMGLTSLTLDNCVQVRDLTPLKDLPLANLSLVNCKSVTDVTPLKDLKLTTLKLPKQKVAGMDELQKMPTLTFINNQPAATFWAAFEKK